MQIVSKRDRKTVFIIPNGDNKDGFFFHFILSLFFLLFFFAISRSENDTRCSDGEEGAVFDDTSFTVAQYLIVYEGSCIAWTIAENVL